MPESAVLSGEGEPSSNAANDTVWSAPAGNVRGKVSETAAGKNSLGPVSEKKEHETMRENSNTGSNGDGSGDAAPLGDNHSESIPPSEVVKGILGNPLMLLVHSLVGKNPPDPKVYSGYVEAMRAVRATVQNL